MSVSAIDAACCVKSCDAFERLCIAGQTAGERGGDARVVDDLRHLKGDMMTVSVTAEVKRMYFRISVQTRATAAPMKERENW